MTIGFDVAQTCESRTGCAWYADSLVKALVNLKTKDQFILYHHFGNLVNGNTKRGTGLQDSRVKMPLKEMGTKESEELWLEYESLKARLGNPDIIHANCFRAPRVAGVKLVYTVYDLSFWAKPDYTTEANRLTCQSGTLEALKNADGFIFISKNARDEFERFLPRYLKDSKKPWVVTALAPRSMFKEMIEEGVDNGDKEGNVSAGKPYWLSVGTLEPRKNYEGVLDALELYWAKSSIKVPLVIAGGGGWNSSILKSRIKALEAKGMVKYLGYVEDEALPGLYRNAKALLFPSFYEGFGLPIVEALSMGCPVITSNHPCLLELKSFGVSYIDPRDANGLAIEMLKAEPKKTHGLRRRIIKAVCLRKYSWEKTAKKTLAFYKEVLGLA
jgi:glycosyltransferase involved in cell wall biosynthesis